MSQLHFYTTPTGLLKPVNIFSFNATKVEYHLPQ